MACRIFILMSIISCFIFAQDQESMKQIDIIYFYAEKLGIQADEIDLWSSSVYGEELAAISYENLTELIEILQLAYSQNCSLQVAADYYFNSIGKPTTGNVSPGHDISLKQVYVDLLNNWRDAGTSILLGSAFGPVSTDGESSIHREYSGAIVGIERANDFMGIGLTIGYFKELATYLSTNNQRLSGEYPTIKLDFNWRRERVEYGIGLSYLTIREQRDIRQHPINRSEIILNLYISYGKNFLAEAGLMDSHMPRPDGYYGRLNSGYRTQSGKHVFRWGITNTLNNEIQIAALFISADYQVTPRIQVQPCMIFCPFGLFYGVDKNIEGITLSMKWMFPSS